MKIYVLIIISLMALLGCQTPEQAPFATSDSGDVPIIDSTEPLWTDQDRWTVEESPALEIGVVEGEEPYQLHRVRGTHRLADGRIVVSNLGSYELRVFDAQGRHLHSFGRQGQGPGEFGGSMYLWPAPQNKFVVRGENGRVHLFEEDARFLETLLLDPIPGAGLPWITGVFGDGTWLVGKTYGYPEDRQPGDLITGTFVYHRYTPEGASINPLIEFADRPRYVNRAAGRTNYPQIPLTPEPSLTAGGDGLYYGAGLSPEVERWSIEGRLTAKLRWARQQRRSENSYKRYVEEHLASISTEQTRRLYAHFFAQDLPVPDVLPAFQSLLVDQ